MMKVLSILIVLFWGEINPIWGGDLSKAQSEAKETNKLILLNFSGSDWCGPCIKLKKDIFESEKFNAFAEKKLILLRADFPRLKKNQLDKTQTAKNEEMAEKYNQEGKFPLTVLIDSKGNVLKSWDGYPSGTTPESFVIEIQALADGRK